MIAESTCVVRGTGSKRGRSLWVTPDNGTVRYLHYGRIILGPQDEPIRFGNLRHETGLICLRGLAKVHARGQSFEMSPYDGLYVPSQTDITVTCSADGCDLAECSAPVEGDYPLQFVSFADVRKDAGLSFAAGGPTYRRHVNIVLGKNVQAGRIVAGVTFSEPGNWTSWPPHEHAAMLEEAYLYIDMPKPAWGTQYVYTDPLSPELAVVVHEGDCVIMPEGYHPNVAAPGGSINFLWMMAAQREVTDRQFGVVNVQPEYASGGSGLETGR